MMLIINAKILQAQVTSSVDYVALKMSVAGMKMGRNDICS